MKFQYISTPQQAKGSILIISLILLLVVTAIGVSSISSTGVNEKLASNYSDHGLAFQAAEAALAAGEQRATDVSDILNATGLDGIPGLMDPDCTVDCFTTICKSGLCFNGTYPATDAAGASAGICDTTPLDNNLWVTPETWQTSSRYTEHSADIDGLFQQPRYIVEFMCYTLVDPELEPDNFPPDYNNEWAYTYRITAYGVGRNDRSKSMLQSTFKVALQ